MQSWPTRGTCFIASDASDSSVTSGRPRSVPGRRVCPHAKSPLPVESLLPPSTARRHGRRQRARRGCLTPLRPVVRPPHDVVSPWRWVFLPWCLAATGVCSSLRPPVLFPHVYARSDPNVNLPMVLNDGRRPAYVINQRLRLVTLVINIYLQRGPSFYFISWIPYAL